jgi:hypothetical protein
MTPPLAAIFNHFRLPCGQNETFLFDLRPGEKAIADDNFIQATLCLLGQIISTAGLQHAANTVRVGSAKISIVNYREASSSPSNLACMS